MNSSGRSINLLILVASLGYFVDIFDIVLFNVVKQKSFVDLALSPTQIKYSEINLFNAQMIGMLLGGLLWGIIGDRKGRVTALFGSIIIYSLANIANAFVDSTTWYSVWRFVAGFGLAGELGAGITLVSEVMKKEKRGIGTMIIVSVGALGAVFAGYVGKAVDWRTAYLIGGGMGLLLLGLRVGTHESGMFTHIEHKKISKGNFFFLFKDFKIFKKYIACILIGLPIWYVIGIMINLSNRYGEAFGIKETVIVGTSVTMAYIGLSIGDIFSGILSQRLRSRKKVILLYLFATLATIVFFHSYRPTSIMYFTVMSFIIGCVSGYWALFVTNAAEQFGTNIRSTVANTVPNFVRGSVVPLTLIFNYLPTYLGVVKSGLLIGLVCVSLAIIATLSLEDTFRKDLDYIE